MGFCGCCGLMLEDTEGQRSRNVVIQRTAVDIEVYPPTIARVGVHILRNFDCLAIFILLIERIHVKLEAAA